MQKTLLAAVALIAMGVAAPTFAGEITGKSKATPIGAKTVIAAICAFSGLEDEASPTGAVPGVTQTPHSEGGRTYPPGVASICQFENPGKNPKQAPSQPH